MSKSKEIRRKVLDFAKYENFSVQIQGDSGVYFQPEFDEVKKIAEDGSNSKHPASRVHIPISVELPADALTPVTAFLRLRSFGTKKMFLLESADGGEQVGRYSFLGINPFASLISQDGRYRFEDLETRETEEGETTFDKMGEFLSLYKTLTRQELPPFMGAALGYFSYDCVRFLEDIPQPANRDEAGFKDLHFMFFKTILVFDRLRHRLHLVRLIPLEKMNIHQSYEKACSDIRELRSQLAQPIREEELLELSFPTLRTIKAVEAKTVLGKDRYYEAVKVIKEHIRAGDIFQCVLSDRFSFPVKEDTFLIYRILRMINPSPYLYYLQFGDETLLGASPEMLIKTEGRNVETCPIAGTRPRGRSEDEDLKFERDLNASVKERAEHLMLVDLGRNDIGRVSKAGSVKVKTFMQVERYSHVMHLVSRVSGVLKKQLTPWSALGSCFPAGTLSGAPKIKAMKIISKLEGSPRGPYGGAVICQDFGGDLNTCITIRSLYVKDGIGYSQAGAGIVADSKAEKEYEEVLNKARAVRVAVAAAREVSR